MKIGPTYTKDQERTKIKKCLVTLYPDTEALTTAVRDKFDIIICYAIPETWSFAQITDEFYKKVKIFLENHIYFYVIPEKWRTSGLIDIIAEVFNLNIKDIFQIKNNSNESIIIGRICQITKPLTLQNLLISISQKLDLAPLRYLGDLEAPLQQIAIILDHPLSLQILKTAKRLNIDTIIGSDFTFKTEKLAEELDINLIDVFYLVNLGLLKLTQVLRMEHIDVEFTFINLKPSTKFL